MKKMEKKNMAKEMRRMGKMKMEPKKKCPMCKGEGRVKKESY